MLWCPVDANGQADAERFLHFWDPALPPPLRCEVHAGEVLYLPAGWYHQVWLCRVGIARLEHDASAWVCFQLMRSTAAARHSVHCDEPA